MALNLPEAREALCIMLLLPRNLHPLEKLISLYRAAIVIHRKVNCCLKKRYCIIYPRFATITRQPASAITRKVTPPTVVMYEKNLDIDGQGRSPLLCL